MMWPALAASAAAHGQQVAVCGPAGTFTYAQLLRAAQNTAANLRALGLRPGDRVLFSIRPCVEGIVLALGIVRAGGVIVFIDPGSPPQLFAARLAMARPFLAATESVLSAVSRWPLRGLVRGITLPGYARLQVLHVHAGSWLPGVPRGSVRARDLAREPALLRPGGPEASSLPDPASLGDAVIVFTSGTTAAPKAVVHTHASLAGASSAFAAVLDLVPGETVYTDQMLLGIPALLAGARWDIPVRAPGRDIRAFAASIPPLATTFLVPADVTALLDLDAHPPLRRVLVGGAPVTPALLRRAQRAAPHTQWLGVYGMTEMLPIATVTAAAKIAYDGPGDLVGTPVPGVSVRVRAGELMVRGPGLAAAVLTGQVRTELTEQATGDVAFLAGDQIVLAGRTRDMIIRGSTNIYPGLFEPALASLPGVRDAALVGVARPGDGDERVVLVLVPAGPGGRADAAPCLVTDHQLIDRVRPLLPTVLSHDALPDEVLVADRLALAGRSRKLDRAGMAAYAARVLGWAQ